MSIYRLFDIFFFDKCSSFLLGWSVKGQRVCLHKQCSGIKVLGSAFVFSPISMGTSSVKSALTVWCCFLVLDMS